MDQLRISSGYYVKNLLKSRKGFLDNIISPS